MLFSEMQKDMHPRLPKAMHNLQSTQWLMANPTFVTQFRSAVVEKWVHQLKTTKEPWPRDVFQDPNPENVSVFLWYMQGMLEFNRKVDFGIEVRSQSACVEHHRGSTTRSR